MNMDRGGFGQILSDNVPVRIFGCAFDGVSHGGKINAYAAQSFAENCIQELKRQNIASLDGRQEKDFWGSMFSRLQHSSRNPGCSPLVVFVISVLRQHK